MKAIKKLFSSENKYGYLAKNSLLFTISSFGSKLLAFFLVPLYTHILSTSDYGIVDIVTTTAGLLGFLVTINIGDAVLRFTLDNGSDKEGIFRYGLITITKGGAILSSVVLLCYLLKIIKWPDYCYIFLVLVLMSSAYNTLFQDYLRGVDKIKQVAISGMVSSFISITANIFFLVVLNTGIIGCLISAVLGQAVSTVYCVFQCGNINKIIQGENCADHVKREMIKYSLPLVFNGIAWWVNASLDKYFIVGLYGTDVNGIYAIASKIPTILTTITGIFAEAWTLSAVREFNKEGGPAFFSKLFNLYNTLLVIICSLLILFNVPFARILFAKDFFEAWSYSSILLVSVVFNSLAAFVGGVFSAVKDSRIFAISTITAALVNAVLNAILIPLYGALGAAIATACSFFTIFIIRFINSRKYISWSVNILKTISIYAILIVQVILEHLNGHMYLGQLICVLSIFILTGKDIIGVFRIIKRKVVRNNE